MPGTRGGDRSKRINTCTTCNQSIRPGQHAQMLQFVYLCQECETSGYTLYLIRSESNPRTRHVGIKHETACPQQE